MKPKSVAAYFIVAACTLLIALNVAGFMLFPRLASPLAVLLSNVITIVLLLIAVRPVYSIMQKEFTAKAKDLVALEKAEELLQERVTELQNENQELESRLRTRDQISGAPADLQFTFKLETVQFGKKGYVVREEPVEKLAEDPRYQLDADSSFGGKLSKLADSLRHPGLRKVLYIDKYYFMVTIGIDFRKIKYSVQGDGICFYGVRFTKLHNITEDMPRDEGDISYCWLVNENDYELTINNSAIYDDFRERYSALQRERSREELDSEVEEFCRRYTEVFRTALKERFPAVSFCDSIEDSDSSWLALSEAGSDWRVREIAAGMMVLSTAVDMASRMGPIGLIS